MLPIKQVENLPGYAAPVTAYALELAAESTPRLEDQCILLGHDPKVAPAYFRLCIWSGIQQDIAASYAERSDFCIPDAYKQLLESFNGLSLLGMDLFGIPPSMLEDPPQLDRQSRQCLDICSANLYWRNEFELPAPPFYFGGRHYSHSENIGYFLEERGDILAYLKDGTCVGNWNDFTSFFQSEVQAAIEFEQSPTQRGQRS